MSRGMTLEEARAEVEAGTGKVTRDMCRRLPGESMHEYRPWRELASNIKPKVEVRTEYVEVEKPVEVPGPERIVTVRDDEALRAAQERLEKTQRELDEVRAKSAEQPAYQFQRDFLLQEQADGETLEETDRKLKFEMGALEARRPLKPEDDARWRMLRSKLYTFKG